MSANIWADVLERLRRNVDAEDFRRWFDATAQASDAGDQITVWVPSESIRRHIAVHFQDAIYRSLNQLGRSDTDIRFVVAGYGDEEDGDGEGE